ncbi:MAG: hypothetical protein ACO3JL_14515 [Myxococcota bacterium]
MASKTTKVETIRKRKTRTRGRDRKNALQNHGTTLPREELFKVQPKQG